MKNNNTGSRNNNNNNNYNNNISNSSQTQNHNHQQSTHHDRRKQQQTLHQTNQTTQHFQGQRERSGQRNQHPDSSMGRDNAPNQGNQSNLGSIRFSPGYPTRELPPIETKADPNKKFTGRCRLFVGNLPHNTTEEKLRSLFERFGEVGEVFLGPKSAFAFIKMDTRQNAEAARDSLDCSNYENRTLRVRLAAHAAAIRVKHLSPQVTNELLAYAFRYFGEIERAVVVVDDKGKSIGEGVVEYSRKQSALYAMKRCQQECFMLTASPKPVLVEPFDQQDEDEGLPEKSINKNSAEYKEQRDVGPRFAEQGTFEHTFALRWKELYEVEKQKRERLEQEIQEARKSLANQFEYSRIEHDEIQLRSRLQQLEGNRIKLQQMKEQNVNDAQLREEQRRHQDQLIRQREEDILRRQQLGEPGSLNQQEIAMRMQANVIQDVLNTHEQPIAHENPDDNHSQHNSQPAGPQMCLEGDPGISMNQMNMITPQMSNQPRTFADAAMIGLNQPYIPVQQMNLPPPQNPQLTQPNMFTAFVPQQHQMQIPLDASGNPNFANSQPGPGYIAIAPPQAAPTGPPSDRRQQKFSRSYNNHWNNNAVQQGEGGRQRKRGRY